MKNKEIRKSVEEDFNEGNALDLIYEKYKNESIKDKKLAYLIASLKNPELIKKHRIAINILILVMFLLTCLTAFLGYTIGLEAGSSTPIYWCAVAIIPLIFLIAFIRHSFQAYAAYILLSIIQFPKSLENLGEDLVADIVGILVSVSVIAFVWYLKNKLFPYMGFFGAKKDSSDQYLFLANKLN